MGIRSLCLRHCDDVRFFIYWKIAGIYPSAHATRILSSEINPLKAAIPNTFMGTEVHGQWGYAIGYFVGWFFNIFGEELLWRGYLLPRQQLQYGKWTWLIHGLLWTGWHFFWKWNLLSILPIALAIPFVAQKTGNSWIEIIAHGLLNFIPFVALVYFILN